MAQRSRRRSGHSPTKGPFVVAGLAAGALALAAPFVLQGKAAVPLSGEREPIGGCIAIDGDTLRCGGERVRLLGIDAPELPGHCRPGRNCAPGDPYRSTDGLAAALGRSMAILRTGNDAYGRTLAVVSGPRGDLSCWQLANGQARYVARWDTDRLVARTCPGVAR